MNQPVIFWAIIIGYVIFIFTKGVLKAKKVGNTDDFLVAGRKTGWFFLFCTLGASVMGGGASIGAVGRTYNWGILMALVSTGWYLGFIFSGLVVAPKFRENKLYTIAGYFGMRFGEKPRFLALILSLLFSLFILAAQMAAFGTVLSTILYVTMPQLAGSASLLFWAVIIGGSMVIIYSTAGGLIAVIHTDVYQFIILLMGFIVTLFFCIPALIISWDTITTMVPQTFLEITGGKGWLFLVTTFLAFILGEEFSPAYVTRYCAGQDIKQTKFGIAGAGIFLALTFPIIIFFIALYARVHFPNIESQHALPMVIQNLNNPVVGALIIGAILMAVMSSADSVLNSATTIFVKDLFEDTLGWRDRGDGKMLRLARICSICIGAGAILIAVLWSDIIGLLLLTYDVWAPAIILPVSFGALSKKKSASITRNIFITMVVSTLVSLGYRLLILAHDKWHWSPFSDGVYRFMTTFNTAVFGVAVSCLLFAILGLVSRAGKKTRRRG